VRSFIFAAGLGLFGLTFTGAHQAQAHEPFGFGSFGNGAHDLAPHWHKTYTPFGPTYWYGNGLHDVLPHRHSVSPWGGVRSYSLTPFGPTRSYNGFPGYGGYPGYGGFYPGGNW
jgi:hypothetical protein